MKQVMVGVLTVALFDGMQDAGHTHAHPMVIFGQVLGYTNNIQTDIQIIYK